MRMLYVVSLIAEGIALYLYGRAFGGPMVGLLAVRTVLTIALVVFAWRGNPVVRVVLAAVRLMAGLVGVVMATIVDGAGLATAIGALGGAEIVIGLLLLFIRRRR